jgi:cob(I)alamin adenosyltransferase
MGHRLTKIYTRTGDAGETGLGDGNRIAKDHIRMHTIGTVDELNCHIGLLVAMLAVDDVLRPMLLRIQNDLFDLGGELSIPGYALIVEARITELEVILDELNEPLPPLKNFILPGGSPAAAQCHLARTVCRRAERDIVSLSREVEINQQGRIYLNRLSDLLFVCARSLARRAGSEEILWQRNS